MKLNLLLQKLDTTSCIIVSLHSTSSLKTRNKPPLHQYILQNLQRTTCQRLKMFNCYEFCCFQYNYGGQRTTKRSSDFSSLLCTHQVLKSTQLHAMYLNTPSLINCTQNESVKFHFWHIYPKLSTQIRWELQTVFKTRGQQGSYKPWYINWQT